MLLSHIFVAQVLNLSLWRTFFKKIIDYHDASRMNMQIKTIMQVLYKLLESVTREIRV